MAGTLLHLRAPLVRFLVMRHVSSQTFKGLVLLDDGTVEAETKPGPHYVVERALTEAHRGLPILPDPEIARARDAYNAGVRLWGAA
jgi:hypothetical protein